MYNEMNRIQTLTQHCRGKGGGITINKVTIFRDNSIASNRIFAHIDLNTDQSRKERLGKKNNMGGI
jgi:hypothetical protein